MTGSAIIPVDRLAAKRIVARLDGFATGLGLDTTTVRQIVEVVVADLPGREDEDLAIEARKRMIEATL